MRRRGFTLIELIIVVSVIAILIGILLPRLRGMIDRGNKTKVGAELRALQAAVESYRIDNKVYPPSGSSAWQSALTNPLTRPRLIDTALADPFHAAAGTPYQYGRSPNGFYYIIWSVGPDNAADITGVNNSGTLTGAAGDDIYVSNGAGGTGGF